MFGIREAYGLLTLLALLGGGWLLFESADGVHPGTPVKTRGVAVGEVRQVALGAGGRGAEVRCSLSSAPGAAPRAGSRFWIVRPWFGGLAAGGGGLDTLIKDSYVAYDEGDPAAPALEPGSRVPGMRLPPDSPRAHLDLPPAPGDLEISVRLATSGGLVPAAPVRHRGIPVGLVTSVDLLADGSGVEVSARVERRYRTLVHAESIFWVEGVDIRAGWQGVSVEGLEALLQGAALSFHTLERRSHTPARDGAVFLGLAEPPEIPWRSPSSGATVATSARPDDEPVELYSLVEVHYACRESDWFSKDDRFERVSPGVLHRTPDGLPAVLVLARGVDGRLWIEDGGGEPELRDESIAVVHGDGSVQEAGVAWRGERGVDLALLRLPSLPSHSGRVRVHALAAGERTGPVEVHSLAAEGGWRRLAASFAPDGTIAAVPAETPDGVLIQDGVAVGLWRGARDGVPAAAILFDALPPSLRDDGAAAENLPAGAPGE